MTESPGRAAEIEQRLDELQRQSQARRAELRAIAAELPEATSRRALVRSMVRSVAAAPNRGTVIKRVGLKVLHTPADLVRRLRRA
jgi:hypothetical protein